MRNNVSGWKDLQDPMIFTPMEVICLKCAMIDCIDD